MAPLDGTIRQPPPPEGPAAQPWTGTLDPEKPPPGSDVISVDEDGSVTIKKVAPEQAAYSDEFDENLAEHPALQQHLQTIGQEILEGIQSDMDSRQRWIDNFTRGLDLLGLVIETQERTKGQKRKTSTVRDSTMLESIVKAQAQARAELLPASGPAKVLTPAESSEEEEQAANDFESDLNQALVYGMPEYVPDLDRGFFSLFYGGNMFRYGYHCPIKNRPVVATVAVQDLIVSEEATDLDTAMRVTMRVPAMAPSEVQRRIFHKIWRDVPLGPPVAQTTPDQQKLQELQGISLGTMRPQDQPFTIYTSIYDMDLTSYGLPKEKGAKDGQPLPYRVVTEKYSRQVLRIDRYWKDGDPHFRRKRRIIHWPMVPGLGFLAYGFLHLQGNQVSTLTAVIRLLLDQLMFGAFPGGVKIRNSRTGTNELEPGPGEFVDLDVPAGVTDIKAAIMTMPYKDVNPVSVAFYQQIQQACARVGAAAMLEVGEGRANVPVGTIMAMLEEKSVIMSAVHKRMHEAMAQELGMVRELFAERPEALMEVIKTPRRQWASAAEFENMNLIPVSDPNIPSQVHRTMIATALATLAINPIFAQRLDLDDLLKRALRMIGVSEVDKLVIQPPPQQPQQDPGAAAAAAQMQAKELDVQQKTDESQRKAASELVKAQTQEADSQRRSADAAAQRDSNEKIAGMKEVAELARTHAQMDHQREQAQFQQNQRGFGGQQF